MVNDDPSVILWSEHGGPFEAAMAQLSQEPRYCECAPIPPGRPASRGYVGEQRDPLCDARGRATPPGAQGEGIRREDERSHRGGAWGYMAGPPAHRKQMDPHGSAGCHAQY